MAGTALVDMQQAVAKQTVEKFWQDVQKEPVAAWKEGENKPFPYLKAPTNEAVILSHEHHEAIQAESYTLVGGVRLNVKQTDFQPNQVLLSAYFGHGLQSQPQPGAGLLAQGTVKESGTATLTNELGCTVPSWNKYIAPIRHYSGKLFLGGLFPFRG